MDLHLIGTRAQIQRIGIEKGSRRKGIIICEGRAISLSAVFLSIVRTNLRFSLTGEGPSSLGPNSGRERKSAQKNRSSESCI
jgi:hypothetical protein